MSEWAAMTLARGTRLGAYEIVAPLGAGGMGEVYRARDLRLDREVAIKVLPAQLTDDPVALARFEREAKAVAALTHPGILAIFDFGSAEGVAYAVMSSRRRCTLVGAVRASRAGSLVSVVIAWVHCSSRGRQGTRRRPLGCWSGCPRSHVSRVPRRPD
jgi:hypothetical protein